MRLTYSEKEVFCRRTRELAHSRGFDSNYAAFIEA
jgi:hypothetical protein